MTSGMQVIRLQQLARLPLEQWSSLLASQHLELSQGAISPAESLSHGAIAVLWARRLPTDALAGLLESLGSLQLHLGPQCFGYERVLLGLADSSCQAELDAWCQQHQVDHALVDQLPSLAEPGLVLMYMDSNTIQIECIDEIAALSGVGEQVAAETAAAMRGELDFALSLRQRVAHLEGADVAVIDQVASQMPWMPGLTDLISTLKQHGWKVAIASGGFTWFAERLQRDLGFDAVFANQLGIEGDTLTGQVEGGIVDANRKAEVLGELADRFDIPRAQTVAIGDGANDLKMLGEAALGVAIHAKPLVQEQAQVAIRFSDLEGVALLLRAGELLPE